MSKLSTECMRDINLNACNITHAHGIVSPRGAIEAKEGAVKISLPFTHPLLTTNLLHQLLAGVIGLGH